MVGLGGWWSGVVRQRGMLARQPPLRGPAVGHGISPAGPGHDTRPGGERLTLLKWAWRTSWLT